MSSRGRADRRHQPSVDDLELTTQLLADGNAKVLINTGTITARRREAQFLEVEAGAGRWARMTIARRASLAADGGYLAGGAALGATIVGYVGFRAFVGATRLGWGPKVAALGALALCAT